MPRTFSRVTAAWWAAGLALAIGVGLRLGSVFAQADAGVYLDIAYGQPVMAPFAWRQLGPLLARVTAVLLQVPVESAFLIEGTLALAIFLGVVLALLRRSGAPRWMFPAVAGLFFWSQQFNGLALPDLTYAALLAVFLLLLSRERYLLAGVMLLPLEVARESTLLALICLLIVGYKRLRRQEIVAAVAATLAGAGMVRLLTRHALPNREHLPAIFYMAAKLPENLLKNVFGAVLWANLYPVCAAPTHRIALHLGPLHEIGLCAFAPGYPRQTAFLALASFGLFPLLLWRVRKRIGLQSASVLLRFCVLYGATSFLLAPVLGRQVGRLFGYGWPLFLVALPLLMAGAGLTFASRRAAGAFVALQLAVSWSAWWLIEWKANWDVEIVAVLYAAGWLVLRFGVVSDPSNVVSLAQPESP